MYRFITLNSVEEKIVQVAARKLRLDQVVIQQGLVKSGGACHSNNSMFFPFFSRFMIATLTNTHTL